MHSVFVKTDGKDRIIAVNSGAFIVETAGWIEIDHGEGDRYYHAQGNYLPLYLVTDDGVFRYKLENGAAVERTAEEIAADIAAMTQYTAATEADYIESLESLGVQFE